MIRHLPSAIGLLSIAGLFAVPGVGHALSASAAVEARKPAKINGNVQRASRTAVFM